VSRAKARKSIRRSISTTSSVFTPFPHLWTCKMAKTLPRSLVPIQSDSATAQTQPPTQILLVRSKLHLEISARRSRNGACCLQCKISRQPQIPRCRLTFHSHTIDCDQFGARDLDLSNKAFTVNSIKLCLSTMPFIILRLESNVIDSLLAYQELNLVVPKYLTLRDTIKDICDKRVGYWVYHTMLCRVCHVCNSSQRGRGKFDEFKEHMRTLVFRQNEVFPVHPAREWPTYQTVMSNDRNSWDIKQVK